MVSSRLDDKTPFPFTRISGQDCHFQMVTEFKNLFQPLR